MTANVSKLKQALALHQQGHLAQAEALYKEVLQVQPQHFDALQLLASIWTHRGSSIAAIELFDRALAINPHHASALSNRGVALQDLGRHEEALLSYDRALAIKPDYAEALANRGNALRHLARNEEALLSYDRALAIKPAHVVALSNRGNALRDLHRLDEALRSYDRALAIMPDHAETLTNRGNVLRELKRNEEALQSYDRALAIMPNSAEILSNRGVALQDLKRHEEALQSLDRALAIDPDHAEALSNRGNALRSLERNDEAIQSYDRALAVRPDYAEALSNRGVALRDLVRHEEALQSYARALAVRPDYAETLYNLGNALQDLRRHDEALQSFARALAITPDFPEAHWNEGLCRLLIGDFANGWPKYEWRWKTEIRKPSIRNLTQPLWLGRESVAGKTVFLHSEQGYGDTIQFCRYANQVAALGATVMLEVQPALKTILGALGGVTRVLARGETRPPFDYYCPVASLPLAFNTDLTNIPAAAYLRADVEKAKSWSGKLAGVGAKRIGVAWSGNSFPPNRSIPLIEFGKLIEISPTCYSLQKELRANDRVVLSGRTDLQFFGDELNDFSDTAALIELMDLVITVDTSVAHLAGAMGKPVWILLNYNADWRWLLDRDDSPWYPTARLFRQRVLGNWATVIDEVGERLSEWVKAGPH